MTNQRCFIIKWKATTIDIWQRLKRAKKKNVVHVSSFHEQLLRDNYYDDISVSKKSEEAYTQAELALKKLPSTDPIRLGLALSYSVFHYEIRQDTKKACALAQEVSVCFILIIM